jgi:hypothetical protein
MDEYGETLTIYVWPKGHEEGTAYPEDFREKLDKALSDAGIDWERV